MYVCMYYYLLCMYVCMYVYSYGYVIRSLCAYNRELMLEKVIVAPSWWVLKNHPTVESKSTTSPNGSAYFPPSPDTYM